MKEPLETKIMLTLHSLGSVLKLYETNNTAVVRQLDILEECLGEFFAEGNVFAPNKFSAAFTAWIKGIFSYPESGFEVTNEYKGQVFPTIILAFSIFFKKL